MKPKKQIQAPAKAHPADAIEHPFIHFCDHPGCRAWGSFGFGVSLRHGRRGRWFCAEHKADGEHAATDAAPAGTGPQSARMSAKPAERGDKQGKLL
ncbi:MAG: hypothetical protein AB1918_18790 [Pseudomonadota bacterium]